MWHFWYPSPFPTTNYFQRNAYVVAPFWSDVDIRREGAIFYEVHQLGANLQSNALIERVSSFIVREKDSNFTGNWMLVVKWDKVHPFPHGSYFDTSVLSDGYRQFVESVRAHMLPVCGTCTFYVPYQTILVHPCSCQ